MDWGIVASVVVAVVLLIAALVIIGILVFKLAARRMRRQAQAGGIPKCPIPGCPCHKEIENALSATKSEG